MLITLVLLPYVLGLCYLYGLFTVRVLGRLTVSEEGTGKPPGELIIILGMACLAFLLGAISVFAPINLRVHGVLGLGAILIGAFFRKDLKALFQKVGIRRPPLPLALTAIVLFVLALSFGTGSPFHYDTGLYHAQAIEWIEKYPATPGLANLHDRLGFNSNWHLLAAFWGFWNFGLHLYNLPGLALLTVVGAYLFKKSADLTRSLSPDNLLAFGYLCFFIIQWNDFETAFKVSSPATDMPFALLTWLIILLALEGFLYQKNSLFPAIFLLSAFDVTLKLSAIPLILRPVYWSWKELRKRHWKAVLGATALSSLLTVPWFIRTIIQTGYLFYPFPQLDLFNFDWKVPVQSARLTAEGVTSFARIPHQPNELVLNMAFRDWFPVWLSQQNTANLFLLGGILASFSAGFVFFLVKRPRPRVGDDHILALIALAGVLFWFNQAPHFRFGYGFVVPAFLLGILPLASNLASWGEDSINAPVRLAFVACFLFACIQLYGITGLNWEGRLIVPRGYPKVGVSSVVVDGSRIYLPKEGFQCWYKPFPCTPLLPDNIRLRGRELKNGFYIKE
jgi:hypothetical protein